MKKIACLFPLLLLLACGNNESDKESVSELPKLEEGPMIISTKMSEYEMYVGKTVARVHTQLTNSGQTALVNYIVSGNKKGIAFSDTVLVELPSNDTVKTEVIFTDIPFKDGDTLPVAHQLTLINP